MKLEPKDGDVLVVQGLCGGATQMMQLQKLKKLLAKQGKRVAIVALPPDSTLETASLDAAIAKLQALRRPIVVVDCTEPKPRRQLERAVQEALDHARPKGRDTLRIKSSKGRKQ
jgi:dethiobiotin synthetase